MRHNLNLNWLRSFEAAARLLSFTAASQEIGLTQTAVSQHIKALEAQLGAKLFVRRPKSLQLTDMGKAYLVTVGEALTTIEMSTSGLFGPRQTRNITVRASMAFLMWMSPRLETFLHQHPDIDVKLVTSIWKGSTDQQPVDIDVVLASNRNVGPDLEHLSDESIVPLCCATMGHDIQTPDDLARHKPIHIMGFDDHWARYLSAFGVNPAGMNGRLITDTSTAAAGIVAAGLGCAVVIARFAHQIVETDPRVFIVGDPVALGQSHFLVRRRDRPSPPPEVQAFETWLRQQF